MARAPHQRGGGLPLQPVEIGVTADLRGILAAAKAFSPAAARNLRRELRASGAEITNAQKAILSGPLPGNAVKTGKEVRRVRRANGRTYLRAVNVYRAEAAKQRGSYLARSGEWGHDPGSMRAQVKRALKNRVVAGKTRSGIQIRAEPSIGGKMTKTWNKKVFRHRVFGTDRFVSQFGQPYWWEPIKQGQGPARARAIRAINDTITQIQKG